MLYKPRFKYLQRLERLFTLLRLQGQGSHPPWQVRWALESATWALPSFGLTLVSDGLEKRLVYPAFWR